MGMKYTIEKQKKKLLLLLPKDKISKNEKLIAEAVSTIVNNLAIVINISPKSAIYRDLDLLLPKLAKINDKEAFNKLCLSIRFLGRKDEGIDEAKKVIDAFQGIWNILETSHPVGANDDIRTVFVEYISRVAQKFDNARMKDLGKMLYQADLQDRMAAEAGPIDPEKSQLIQVADLISKNKL
jgi:hypothetical protein